MSQGYLSLAKSIDHTLLRPNATTSDYSKLCDEAAEHKFFSVCVPPSWVHFCNDRLSKFEVQICTVVGFPFGYTFSSAKADETMIAIQNGADEIDMVMNFSALLSGDTKSVARDIELVRKASGQKILKVILETCYLNSEQIVTACRIAESAGANFVKTSTGFGTAGASVENVKLMRETVGAKVQVKASGGVRDYAGAMAMIAAGATRLGTSNGVSILSGAEGQEKY